MKKLIVALGICLLTLTVSMGGVKPPVLADDGVPTPTPLAAPQSCEQIAASAFAKLQDACSQIGRNTACYGNYNVQADLQDNSGISFLQPGDQAPIKVIKSLVTSTLDQETGAWGLSLLKVQANLPDTLPGQNVTFLVYGDTSIQNVDGSMRAFYFSTGLGAQTCNQAPPSTILVRSPEHMQVSFTANGVTISIASTISLRAVPNQAMSVELIEGHATVSDAQGARVLQPGQMTSIKMGGKTGLDPQGAPAAAVDAAPKRSTLRALSALDDATGTKGSITIRGCISKIEHNVATVGDFDIPLAANNPALSGLAVGSCVTLSGTVSGNGANDVVMAPDHVAKVSPAHGNNPNAKQGKSGNAGNGNNGNGNGNSGNGNSGSGNGNSGNSGNSGNGNSGNGNSGSGNGNSGNSGNGNGGNGNSGNGGKKSK